MGNNSRIIFTANRDVMKNIVNSLRSEKIINCCTKHLLNIYESIKTDLSGLGRKRLITRSFWYLSKFFLIAPDLNFLSRVEFSATRSQFPRANIFFIRIFVKQESSNNKFNIGKYICLNIKRHKELQTLQNILHGRVSL